MKAADPHAPTATGTRPGGRSARVVAAVLEATRAELARVGLGALSVERVAEIAGVAKTTVYRRWPRKSDLVRDALIDRIERTAKLPPDEGTLLDQLTRFAHARAVAMSKPDGQVTLRMLYSENQNPEVQELLRSMRTVKLSLPLELFQRAEARKEIPRGADVELAWHMIMGSLHHRVVLMGDKQSRSSIRQLVQAVLYGVVGSRR